MSTTGTPNSSLNLDGLLNAVETQTVAYEDALQKLVEKSDPSGGDDLLIRNSLIQKLGTKVSDYHGSLVPASEGGMNFLGEAMFAADTSDNKKNEVHFVAAMADNLFNGLIDSGLTFTNDSSQANFRTNFVELVTDKFTADYHFESSLTADPSTENTTNTTPSTSLLTNGASNKGINKFKSDLIDIINQAKSSTEQTLNISEATVLTTEVQLEQGKSDLVSGIAKSATDFIKKLAQKMQ
jgi:hypothetical protein